MAPQLVLGLLVNSFFLLSFNCSSSYKYPWARVLCYLGGQGKSGRQQIQEVARYPNLMSQSSSQHYCGPTHPSLILPCNRIHVKIGGCSTRPGRLLNVLAIPAEFPLALSFIHCFCNSVALLKEDALSERLHKTLKALSICLESLSKFLNRINCPIPLKEVVLHQLSDTIWTVCSLGKMSSKGEITIAQTLKLYTFPSKFIQSTQQELLKLYEIESSCFTKSKSGDVKCSFPPPESIGAGGLGRFSSYFQSLLEFVLAVLEYQHKFHGADSFPSCPSLPTLAASPLTLGTQPVPVSTAASSSKSSSVDSTSTVSSSGSDISLSATPMLGAAPIAATSSTDPPSGKKPAKRTRSRKTLLKKEGSESSVWKDTWLKTLSQSTAILRAISSPGRSESFHFQIPLKTSPMVHPSSRLIVLTGIPTTLSLEQAEAAIRKACKLYGGLYRQMLFLPADKDKPSHHCGHAVLELSCSSRTSGVCSALLALPSLQQEDGSLQAMAVDNSFFCGEQERVANEVLASFLKARLTRNTGSMAGAPNTLSALSDIFKSSCLESTSSLSISQISGPLLKLFSIFAENCSIPLESFMEELWKGYGDKNGLLTLRGFCKYFGQDTILIDDLSIRGMWLGLMECGYDLSLDRYAHCTGCVG